MKVLEEVLLYIALIVCLQAIAGTLGVAAAVVIYCRMKTHYGSWGR